jgi:hypothetical protein
MCIHRSGDTAHKAECYKVFSLKYGKLYSCFTSCIGPEYKTNEVIYSGSIIYDVDNTFGFPHYKYNENYKYNPYPNVRQKFSAFATKYDAKLFLTNIKYSELNTWAITVYPKVIKKVLMWDVDFGHLGIVNTYEYQAAIGSAILVYPEEIV